MPRCSRCGQDVPEAHEISSSTADGLMQKYKYADGTMIDGQKVLLCTASCFKEFLGMLQGGNTRSYPDPTLPT